MAKSPGIPKPRAARRHAGGHGFGYTAFAQPSDAAILLCTAGDTRTRVVAPGTHPWNVPARAAGT